MSKNYNFSVINFASEKIKEFFFQGSQKFIPWGVDNMLPLTYLNYYDTVAEHMAAINFTESNVVQSGWGNLDYWLIKKIVFDYMMFGTFALEVVQTRGGQNTINYIDISKCRLAKEKDRVGYIEDLYKNKYEYQNSGYVKSTFEVKWYPLVEDLSKGGIYIYKNSKTREAYGKPIWSAAITALDTMSTIQNFHNSNAKCGFSPTVILNMNNGEPDDATKKKIEKDIKTKFIGTDGQKFMLMFNDGKENASTVTKITNDSLDQKFETLQKFIQNQIIIGNSITSSQLIGVKQDNQGFSKTEFDESLDIFREWIVKPIQKEITYALNSLLGTDYDFKSEDLSVTVNDNQNQNINE